MFTYRPKSAICSCGQKFVKKTASTRYCEACRKPSIPAMKHLDDRPVRVPPTQEQRNVERFLRGLPKGPIARFR